MGLNRATAGAVPRLAVIGLGPRGMILLERIAAHARQMPDQRMEVLAFDPQPPGPGCHRLDQPDALLMNTVAGQLTLFPDAATPLSAPPLAGDSFLDWLVATGQGGTQDADRYLPRNRFGAYLRSAFDRIAQQMPPQITLTVLRDRLSSVRRAPGGGWLLRTVSGRDEAADLLVLATGHGAQIDAPLAPPTGQPPRIDNPFPLPGALDGVTPDMTVAVEGLGLTAFDILALLTAGRGGRFEPGPGGLRYRRSGHEPRILAFSRSGLPLMARAVNRKGISGQHRPRHLLDGRIDALRRRGPIDFRATILPLIRHEMQHAHDLAQAHCPDAEPAGFSWDRLTAPVPAGLTRRQDFGSWLLDHLKADLAEARRGNLHSPVKAACEVLRDQRETLARAIEFRGLSEASQGWMSENFLPVMNRLAVGPPHQRIAEMIALIEAGVLVADFGPGARCTPDADNRRWMLSPASDPDAAEAADLLIRARLPVPGSPGGAPSLVHDMARAGTIRLFRHGPTPHGGVEVTRRMQLVAASGAVIADGWAYGVVTEGALFHTTSLPCPGVESRMTQDADTLVTGVFAAARAAGAAQPAPLRGADHEGVE